MGIADGFASTVILRAESPADAGGFRQSNAFWGGLSVLSRSVGCLCLGVAQCWYIGGSLALKKNGTLGSGSTVSVGPPVMLYPFQALFLHSMQPVDAWSLR
jgi:hypothetical protein